MGDGCVKRELAVRIYDIPLNCCRAVESLFNSAKTVILFAKMVTSFPYL